MKATATLFFVLQITLLFAVAQARVKVYVCEINGRKFYQDKPCTSHLQRDSIQSAQEREQNATVLQPPEARELSASVTQSVPSTETITITEAIEEEVVVLSERRQSISVTASIAPEINNTETAVLTATVSEAAREEDSLLQELLALMARDSTIDISRAAFVEKYPDAEELPTAALPFDAVSGLLLSSETYADIDFQKKAIFAQEELQQIMLESSQDYDNALNQKVFWQLMQVLQESIGSPEVSELKSTVSSGLTGRLIWRFEGESHLFVMISPTTLDTSQLSIEYRL